MGIDVSETAIRIAKERFSDIEFEICDVNKIGNLTNMILENIGSAKYTIDLIFTSEVFSYIENYKELLKEISKCCKYFMISLYIPQNPIGFVKSKESLLEEVKLSFDVIEYIYLNIANFVIIFAKAKKV